MGKKTLERVEPYQKIQQINPDGSIGDEGEVFQPLATQFTAFFGRETNPRFFFYKDQGVTWRFPK